MSTHKNIDIICVAVLVFTLLLTILFMNGERLGIQVVVDEDQEYHSGVTYFTVNDMDGSWDASSATVITLNGTSAKISGNGAYTVGGDVVIHNAGRYVISGTLEDGSIIVDTYRSAKVWILLDGAYINCTDDACFRVEQADKVFLTLAEGTENCMTSGDTWSETALSEKRGGVIFARDDLTINGSGSLTVSGGYKHGIDANDDIVIAGGSIRISSPRDAIHVKESIHIREAMITLEADDDGIVIKNATGSLYIESGTVSITSGDDAVHTAGDVLIAGGEITINAGDDAIHADTFVTIAGGTVLAETCYEGIEAPYITIAGGDTTIYPKDDGLNASSGTATDMFGMGFGGMGGHGRGGMQMQGFTGTEETTEASSGEHTMPQMPEGMAPPEMPEGMTAPPEMPEDMTAPSAPPEGMETPPQMQGGMQNPQDMESPVQASAAGAGTETGETPYIHITGGTLTVINEAAMDSDGLDSNGDILISGGTVRVSMVNMGSNSALDCASESGGVCEITGGNVIASGSYSMAEGFDATSTQCSILYNISAGAEAGTTVTLEDTDGNVLLSYEVPCSFSSVVLSTPELKIGETYLLTIGDDAEEITIEETSASFGDAQSGMFFGRMNWGGMQGREGFSGFGGGRPGRAQGEENVDGGMPQPQNSGEAMPDAGGMTLPEAAEPTETPKEE